MSENARERAGAPDASSSETADHQGDREGHDGGEERLEPPGGLHNPTKEAPLGEPPNHASRIVGG